ncbi:MAG: PIN/TRAM domain-containing protein [Phycisphaerae bacterium]|nr:PIN/TRAM domain-containing protein [Phycisphaerae bacterium]
MVRLVFVLLVLAITVSFAFQEAIYAAGARFITLYILTPTVLALTAVIVDMFWRKKRLQELSGLFFGVLAGMVIAFMLTLLVDLVLALFPVPQEVEHPGQLPPQASVAVIQEHTAVEKAYNAYATHIRIVQLIKLLLGAASVYVCVSFVLQTRDDFRFIIPYVEFSRDSRGARPLLLDTSVIIDGRVSGIAETGILESEIIVPRFVLAELQTIADSDDKLKRNRGRRGLDVLKGLQDCPAIRIRIDEARIPEVEASSDVDAKLVAMADHLNGRVVTNDFNLNKVAQLRGVDVINVNDLANAMKPVALPGETMWVKILKAGEQAGQGVGYLDDGTMIVVEQGRDHMGRDIAISVTSVMQTSAGRMIFGTVDPDKTFAPRRESQNTRTPDPKK